MICRPAMPRLLFCLLGSLLLSTPAWADPSASDATPRPPTREELTRYPWLSKDARVRPLEVTLAPPSGYTRVAVEPGSFGAWLRGLPLRPEGTPVRDFQGGQVLAGDDPRLAAVAELDVGSLNLQQCADTIIRLHAEWLWAQNQKERIAYRFTSGDLASWPRYAAGERAKISGSKVKWARSASAVGNLKAHGENRIEAGHRLLENHRDLIAPNAAHLPRGEGGEVLIAKINAIAQNLAGRLWYEPENRQRGHRFTTAGLAHHTEGLTGIEGIAHAIDRFDYPFRGVKMGL
jgi:hypothetical protein